MKRTSILFFAITSLLICQCKKETPHIGLTMTLYDKPLDSIQSYISGKWKLEYTYGGFIANLRTDVSDKNDIWQIDNGINIKTTVLGNIVADTSIEWEWDSVYTGVGRPTYTMKFYDKRQYPYKYVVIGIVNDSLQLKDYGNADAATYHFSKQK